jgi:hypothetical protein
MPLLAQPQIIPITPKTARTHIQVAERLNANPIRPRTSKIIPIIKIVAFMFFYLIVNKTPDLTTFKNVSSKITTQ